MPRITQVTPYSAPAAAVLKAAYEVCEFTTRLRLIDRDTSNIDLTQAWKAQKERDSKVAELSRTIADLWEFMEHDPSLDKVKAVQKTVQGMLRQTEECAKFIREYTTSTNTGMRLARSIFSDNDSMINDFQGAFTKLKSDYLNGIDLATIVTLTAITSKLELMQQTLEKLGSFLPHQVHYTFHSFHYLHSPTVSASERHRSCSHYCIRYSRSSPPPETLWSRGIYFISRSNLLIR